MSHCSHFLCGRGVDARVGRPLRLTSCLRAAQVWEAQRENGRGGHDHPAGHESLGGLEFWTRHRSV